MGGCAVSAPEGDKGGSSVLGCLSGRSSVSRGFVGFLLRLRVRFRRFAAAVLSA